VGVDFGTYSTKILIRPRGEEKAELVQIEPSAEGYPWFASPSLVRVVDDKVFFGGLALEKSGGSLYRSLKVRLLEAIEQTISPDFQRRDTITPDLLVAGYLSWVLGRLKRQIDARYRYGSPRVFLNMAAPMNHIEDKALKTRYLRIIQAAWESVFGAGGFPAEQGMPLKDLESRFAPWLDRQVPDRTVRLYEVLPETLAPIVSLSLDPRMDAGMYMIVDMGAGTTEISVNHLGQRHADQIVLCYADESIRIGGDDFSKIEDDLRGQADAIRHHHQELVDRFLKVFRRTWFEGYRKDMANHTARRRWQQLCVLLAGGAARRDIILDAIRGNCPMYAFLDCDRLYEVRWHKPIGIEMGHPQEEHSESDNTLLSVAHGLSVPRQQWPISFPPSDVEHLPGTEVIEKPPAYWWSEP